MQQITIFACHYRPAGQNIVLKGHLRDEGRTKRTIPLDAVLKAPDEFLWRVDMNFWLQLFPERSAYKDGLQNSPSRKWAWKAKQGPTRLYRRIFRERIVTKKSYQLFIIVVSSSSTFKTVSSGIVRLFYIFFSRASLMWCNKLYKAHEYKNELR